ncbi:MAG: putative rane protein [Micavibrio sp.]|nr:putative rane protein [Micavibrio sp.]
MQRIQKALFWSIVASESTHVFCCVLPTLVSVISLVAGMSALSFLPGFVLTIHETLHAYEVPTIFFSGLMLAIGWALQGYSKRLDCGTAEDSCCSHEPCAPRKDHTFKIMIGATALFAFNVGVYFVFHYGHSQF